MSPKEVAVRPALAFATLFPALFMATAEAQTDQPAAPARPAQVEQAKPAAPETPPESQAFTDASRIMDPAKKIEALEKWKKDYPNASNLASADELILSTLIERFPQQGDRIRKLAKIMYQGAKPGQRSSTANRVANALLEGDAFLKDAEHYAKIGVSSLNQAKYVEEHRKQYAARKQKAPSDDDLIKRFRETRADRIATLGRVYFKMGRTDKAKPLLEESYGVLNDQMVGAAALGDIALKAGDQAKANEYLIPALLSGRPAATAIAKPDVEAVYRKTHGGSLDGFDAMLDAEYRKRFPNPVSVEHYKPSEKRSDRLVLAEVFTGAGCPPCVGADLAFDAALERYSRNDLAVVMYHVHVPQPDPMTTAETPDLSKTYAVRGVPTYFIDGKTVGGGGGGRDYAKNVYQRFNPMIEKELERPAEAKITATAALEGNTVRVKTSVTDIKSDSDKLKLVALLLEKQIRYSGENGIRFHPMVVRAAAEQPADRTFGATFDLDEVSASLKKSLDEYEAKGHRGKVFKFTEKKYQIDRGNLAVAVFLKDPKDQHVLQAVYIDLSPSPAEHRVTETR
jgi:thiol-disulfide isomerase/thioredoxin